MKTTVSVSKDVAHRIKLASVLSGRFVQDIVDEALKEWLSKTEAKLLATAREQVQKS